MKFLITVDHFLSEVLFITISVVGLFCGEVGIVSFGSTYGNELSDTQTPLKNIASLPACALEFAPVS